MDINQLIREAAQEVFAESRTNEASTATQQTTAPANGPITVNIQGQQVTFRDQADLEAQLNSTAQAIAAQRAAPPPAPAPALAGSRVTDDNDSPSFDNEKYIKLMNEDPRVATNYALSHLLFDGRVEDPAALIRESMIAQSTQSKQLAAYQFRDNYREVPLEDPRVGPVLDATRKELGLPYTSVGLEAAYVFAVNKGKLPDFKQLAAAQAAQQAQPQPQPEPQYGGQQYQQPANPYLQGPPVANRSTNVGIPLTMNDVEDMSLDQLASFMRKLEANGVRS